MQCHLIGGSSLQPSCRTTCFNSWNKPIWSHLVVLKMAIFISDKVERYDEQKKHPGSLRLFTQILLSYAILESCVTKPKILVKSGQLQMSVIFCVLKYLTIIIEWGWAKYLHLSVANTSILLLFAKAEGCFNYWSARNWQITIFFKNCFIIRSLFFWSTKDVKPFSDSSRNQSAIFTQECGFNYTEYYLQQNTYL